jgi:hypothetical protein
MSATFNDLSIAALRVYSDNPNDLDVPAMVVQWTRIISVESPDTWGYKGEAWVNKSPIVCLTNPCKNRRFCYDGIT